MIGYITLGSNNIERAAKFYDTVLKEMGAERYSTSDGFISWQVESDQPMIAVVKPYDGEPASTGNGVMVALAVPSQDVVDALYNQAIEQGGTDEGKPGFRGKHFYAGYFRDLDGNKFNAFHID